MASFQTLKLQVQSARENEFTPPDAHEDEERGHGSHSHSYYQSSSNSHVRRSSSQGRELSRLGLGVGGGKMGMTANGSSTNLVGSASAAAGSAGSAGSGAPSRGASPAIESQPHQPPPPRISSISRATCLPARRIQSGTVSASAPLVVRAVEGGVKRILAPGSGSAGMGGVGVGGGLGMPHSKTSSDLPSTTHTSGTSSQAPHAPTPPPFHVNPNYFHVNGAGSHHHKEHVIITTTAVHTCLLRRPVQRWVRTSWI